MTAAEKTFQPGEKERRAGDYCWVRMAGRLTRHKAVCVGKRVGGVGNELSPGSANQRGGGG